MEVEEAEPTPSAEETTGTPVPVSGNGGDGAQGVPTPDITSAAELGRFDAPFPYAVLLTKTGSLHVKSLVGMNKKLPKDISCCGVVFYVFSQPK